ncbi:MAG: hypothetical protein ACRD3S_14680 [Terracidiphilus sp.]
MTIHPNVNGLTIEAIEEYLDIAKFCISSKKQDGGIYGYPATLLLFSVINAIGESQTAGNEPFRVLKEKPFGCQLNDRQIKKLEQWYRNLLTHNGMIAPGACLSPEDRGDPFKFDRDEPVMIRVKPLYTLVRNAWDQFDKANVNAMWRPAQQHIIANPLDLSGSTPSVSATASGSICIPILVPKKGK